MTTNNPLKLTGDMFAMPFDASPDEVESIRAIEPIPMRVHRNLHNARKGGPQWVVTRRGKVFEYLESCTLSGVTTRIQPAGQAKCAEKQVRSVCAYFDGFSSPADPTSGTGKMPVGNAWKVLAYDPRCDTEFMADGQPWNTADAAYMAPDGTTYILNPTLEN